MGLFDGGGLGQAIGGAVGGLLGGVGSIIGTGMSGATLQLSIRQIMNIRRSLHKTGYVGALLTQKLLDYTPLQPWERRRLLIRLRPLLAILPTSLSSEILDRILAEH